MKQQRPASGSPRTPRDSTPDRGTPRRLRTAGTIGAAAAFTILVGLGPAASSAPRPSEAQPQVTVTVSGQQAPQTGANADTGSELIAAPAKAVQPQAVKQPQSPTPAAEAPAAPGEPGAPIAELRRASTAFEAAAGKASAPGPAPAPGAPNPAKPNFTDVAIGAALGELQGRYDEYQHYGWVQTGSATLTGTERVEVVRVNGIPTHRFAICVDSSGVEVRDTSGAVVLAAARPGTRTANNIYDIQQHKGKWVVVGHSFPDVAAC
ncbi:hypothetical protein [Pseudarthrobacter sulfonivorans]|uniref:hypothetical protein n=1 Tax=Pseudarthrobacter sulfonivorans TaxID=121292 RepID=UPI0028649655|nr:hypothetical protein [Pseudarthrobacter sulfonivorans]MDR6414902.1 hypothetical protein [Pseudarthrobacter sulfonivorans]